MSLATVQLYNAVSNGFTDFIIVIGDSLMAAAYPQGFGPYPNVNVAIQGETMIDIYANQMSAVDDLCALCAPKGIIFSGGTNDVPPLIAGTETAAAFQTALQNVINHLRTKVVDSKILAVIPPPTTASSQASMFAAVSGEYVSKLSGTSIMYLPMAPLVGNGASPPVGVPGYFIDGTHYNQTGWGQVKPAIDGAISTLGW